MIELARKHIQKPQAIQSQLVQLWNRRLIVSVFDQRGQSVTYQYNSAGNINFGAVQNRMDLVSELEKLKFELYKATQQNVFDTTTANKADANLQVVVEEAKKNPPDKQIMLERIEGAKKLIEGVTAASGMITALATAADLVQKFF